MKKIIMSSCFLISSVFVCADDQEMSARQQRPAALMIPDSQDHGERTPLAPRAVPSDEEQSAFAQHYRALAESLERRLRDLSSAQPGLLDSTLLRELVDEAEFLSREVHNGGNAAFHTSAGFSYRFMAIARRAQQTQQARQ